MVETHLVGVDEAAPSFVLPGADRYGDVSLREYLGRGADPEMTTHAAYGLPKIPKARWRDYRSIRIDPTGELPAPLTIPEANEALGQLDLFTPTTTDHEDIRRTWNQLHGLFLIDRTNIVRWVFVEASDGLASMGRYPAEAELVATARALLR